MNNEQSSLWQNLLMFVCAAISFVNLRLTIKGIKKGIEFDRLLKENIELKRRITKLENDRASFS